MRSQIEVFSSINVDVNINVPLSLKFVSDVFLLILLGLRIATIHATEYQIRNSQTAYKFLNQLTPVTIMVCVSPLCAYSASSSCTFPEVIIPNYIECIANINVRGIVTSWSAQCRAGPSDAGGA